MTDALGFVHEQYVRCILNYGHVTVLDVLTHSLEGCGEDE